MELYQNIFGSGFFKTHTVKSLLLLCVNVARVSCNITGHVQHYRKHVQDYMKHVQHYTKHLQHY